MCVVHVIVVVADTTRSLTCHTRSSSNPPSRSSPPCSSSASILARQAHALPTCATAILPLPPSPLSSLHPTFPSLSLSPFPSSCHATPARQRRYPWADTGDARASLHLRSTLRALAFPPARTHDAVPAGSLTTSPPSSRPHRMFLFLFALSRAGRITIVPVLLSRSRLLALFILTVYDIPRLLWANILAVYTDVHRLLLSIFSYRYLRERHARGSAAWRLVRARVYSGVTCDLGSCRKPPTPHQNWLFLRTTSSLAWFYAGMRARKRRLCWRLIKVWQKSESAKSKNCYISSFWKFQFWFVWQNACYTIHLYMYMLFFASHVTDLSFLHLLALYVYFPNNVERNALAKIASYIALLSLMTHTCYGFIL